MRNSMKSTLILAIILIATTFTACKKEKTFLLPDEALALLPEHFAKELIDNGFIFHTGNNPAVANNIYFFQPINEYDNSEYFSVGQAALDVKIKIANQTGTNADIFVYNWVAGSYDTSYANIIIGDGNNITAIAQAKGTSNGFTYKYDYVISGTLTNSGLKDIKFAFVMVDNPGAPFIATTGTQRIFHDANDLAEFTTTFRLSNTNQQTQNNKDKSIFSR